MMRSLYTAASGMKSQQLNVDTIANNLSNVNTTSFKKERIEFKSLLYETMLKANTDENGKGRPVNLQVGHGVRPSATVKTFSQGNIEGTSNPFDFAIEGKGFFQVQGPNGEKMFTRDGAFKLSIVDDEYTLVSTEGYPIVGEDDEPLKISADIDMTKLQIESDGTFGVLNDENQVESLDIQFKIVQFRNPVGLEAAGGNFYKTTSASGEEFSELEMEGVNKSELRQGFIEGSNVEVVQEMVNLIVAQRAYEVNSKAIQASDEMLTLANQLKR